MQGYVAPFMPATKVTEAQQRTMLLSGHDTSLEKVYTGAYRKKEKNLLVRERRNRPRVKITVVEMLLVTDRLYTIF